MTYMSERSTNAHRRRARRANFGVALTWKQARFGSRSASDPRRRDEHSPRADLRGSLRAGDTGGERTDRERSRAVTSSARNTSRLRGSRRRIAVTDRMPMMVSRTLPQVADACRKCAKSVGCRCDLNDRSTDWRVPPDTKDRIVYAATAPLRAERLFGRRASPTFCRRPASTPGACTTSSRASRTCCSRCSTRTCTASIRCCSSRRGRVWTIRSNACSRCSPATARRSMIHGLHLRMPDRQHRARATRARSAGACDCSPRISQGGSTRSKQCFVDAGDRLPADVDRRALAVFALTTMEGGVMVSRTDRTLACVRRRRRACSATTVESVAAKRRR